MLNLVFALVILSSTNYVVPGSTLHLYLTDSDLNTNHSGIDTIQATGLLEFTINGIAITGPATMRETAVNSGIFAFDVNIPTTINGKSLGRGDILLIKYHDQSDATGESNTITKSISLSKTLSQLSTSTKSVRIGEMFRLQLYEPDWNLNSKNPDTIPLKMIEFRAKGIRTTLANSAFDVSTPGLRETGSNTNLFVANLEIPRHIDGKIIKIGSIVEFRFIDTSSASSTPETLKTKLKVGYSK